MQRLSSGLDMETLRAARHCAGLRACVERPPDSAASRKPLWCSSARESGEDATMFADGLPLGDDDDALGVHPRADPVWPDLCSRRTRSSSAALSVLSARYSATTVLPRSSPGPIAWSPVSAPYPGTCWCSRATFRSPARHTSDAGGHYMHLADPAYLEVDGSRSSSTQTARGGRARPS